MTRTQKSNGKSKKENSRPENIIQCEYNGINVEVCARPFKNPKYSLASVTITIEDFMVIGDIYLNESKAGNWYLSFPSYKVDNKTYKDMTFPLSKELRDTLTDAASESYDIATR